MADTIESPTEIKTLNDLVNYAMGWAKTIAVIMLLAYITYGGYTKLTAAGDPEKEAKSPKIITMAIVGFFIIIVAPFITKTIGALFGTSTI